MLLCVATPATAAQRFGLSLGFFDFTQEQEAVEAGLDVHFRERLLGVRPVLGLGLTSDEATFVYAGLRRPVRLGGSGFHLVPNFAVALFDRGDGKDLGFVVEFRSGIELLYELGGGARLGFGFYHMSNASIDDTNPGANSFLLRYLLAPRRP